MFGTILISVYTAMHLYISWRVFTLPTVKRYVSRKIFISLSMMLWGFFFIGRHIGHGGSGMPAHILEFLGMNWMAILFLMFFSLLAVDFMTLYGFLFPRLSVLLRGGAVLLGLMLSMIAFVQGNRAPVIGEYDVNISELPDALDGTVIVALSDLHLGSQLGGKWMSARVAQVKALNPDLILLLGDIFEGHGPPEPDVISAFKGLSAPLGIWAVFGNHEFHGGGHGHIRIFNSLNIDLLRNRWVEVAPGLVLAGVDDLTNRHRNGLRGGVINKTLSGVPAGPIILLSHTPWEVEAAAQFGVDLILSGHTHGGQIWPFDYLVRYRYPFFEGRYAVGGTTVVVSRGAGTWGPRMRLWQPGEIVRVVLRSNNE